MNRRPLRVAILVIFAVVNSFVLAEDRQADKASDQPVAATVKVQAGPPIPLGTGFKWKNVPDYLTNASIYEKPLEKPSLKLEFEVQKDGVVVMAASWNYDGNASGGWKETRWTEKMLADAGWIAIGKMDRMTKDDKADMHTIFRRVVKAGEKFQIHTRKYNTPHLILPAVDHLKEVMAAKAVIGTQVAATSSTTAPTTGATPRRDSLSEYQDQPGNDAILVGLRVTVETYQFSRKLGSIQPIYDTAQGRKYGQIHGVQIGNILEVQAKPGYAIGGLTLSTGETLGGLRALFLRRTETGLDREDSYGSRWIGDQTGDTATRVDATDRPFVGIRGQLGDSIRTIELISAKR